MKAISWKLVLVCAITLAAIIYILPTFNPSFWPHKKINLGLDLQGGMHMVLGVQSQAAVNSNIETIADDIKSDLREKRISYKKVARIKGDKVSVTISGEQNINQFDTYLNNEYPNLQQVSRAVTDGTLTEVLDLPAKDVAGIKEQAVSEALEIIRNRIDQFGVSEPDIRREGKEDILVELPGVQDAERAKELLGQTAQLEFKLVDSDINADSVNPSSLPPDLQLLYEYKTDPVTQRTTKIPYVVYKKALIPGTYVTSAKGTLDSEGNPIVTLSFNKKGGRIFERVTGENVGKQMAIVLDNKVKSAPVIKERISGGSCTISGSFTTQETHNLAIVLRSGSLPAPVKILEERTVGASLGADSIHKGLLSVYIGGILVVVFMALYYNFSGLVADAALVVNLLLIGAGMVGFGATLTLPGIAGIILTIGMAVDSNVLIFERIREELEIGKTARAALDAGYERATLTILDANVTTLIAALVLFQFGTGPIKGFAVTLSLGVCSSVFTALVLTRVIFDVYFSKRNVKKLSI